MMQQTFSTSDNDASKFDPGTSRPTTRPAGSTPGRIRSQGPSPDDDGARGPAGPCLRRSVVRSGPCLAATGRTRRRADSRGGRPVQPPPDHPGPRVDGQKRLKNAHVLVIGAGGLGSPTLHLPGRRRRRHPGHRRVRRRRRVQSAAPDHPWPVRYRPVEGPERPRHRRRDQPAGDRATARVATGADNAVELFAQYDLIIDGTDNFATRYLVNDAAVLAHKPYVWGSIYRFEGQVSVFWEDAP